MKIRTEEHSFIFEEFTYTIPDDFDFPQDFEEWTDDEQIHYLNVQGFDAERTHWEYGDESRLDNLEIIR